MVITVVGLGFVGLTTALGFAEYGHKVYGVDSDAERLAQIAGGRIPFEEPGLDQALARHLGNGFVPVRHAAAAAGNTDAAIATENTDAAAAAGNTDAAIAAGNTGAAATAGNAGAAATAGNAGAAATAGNAEAAIDAGNTGAAESPEALPVAELSRAVFESDLLYFCVGTPCGDNGEADLSSLYTAIRQSLAHARDGRFRAVVVKSTVPPSTAKKRIIPFIEGLGFQVPEQIGVGNNPEFLREGHCWEDFMEADRIVIGAGDARTEAMLRNLYAPQDAPVCAVSLNTAEFIKYLSNSVLAALISFSNEMSLAADAFGDIQTAEAFRILHMDKRWQNGSIRSYFYPGCGYGGYCLPKDTVALAAAAKNSGMDTEILHAVVKTNDRMPHAAAERVMKAAGEDRKKCIGILGLSFNAGSDDVREAISAKIIKDLNDAGYGNIVAYDPMAMENFQKAYPLKYRCAENRAQVLEEADVIALAQRWPEFKGIQEETGKPTVDLVHML